jgi:hypothetical protein
MRRAVYVRVSKERQAHLQTIEQQLERLQAHFRGARRGLGGGPGISRCWLQRRQPETRLCWTAYVSKRHRRAWTGS